jgi:sec-independent protein translocase protein TatA
MLGWQELILIFALLLFVFGPTNLPKIARELGKAMREFNKATSGLATELNKVTSDSMKDVRSSSTGDSRPSLKAADKWKIDKTLSDIAKKLNIDAEGKTNEQIAREINERLDSQEKASNITAVKR